MITTPLVTLRQAAKQACVSEAEVRRWIRAGRVTPVACHVVTRALLVPLATVMRAERDVRWAKVLRRAERNRIPTRRRSA